MEHQGRKTHAYPIGRIEMMQGDFGDEEIAPAAKGIGFGSPAVRWGYPLSNGRVLVLH
jgi:hypothetical protein